jgi:predicted sugar kinase
LQTGLTRFQDASPEFISDFKKVEPAVLTIIATIPSVPRLPTTAEQYQFDQELANLANAQTIMRAVLIQLHGPFWQNDPESHAKVIKATQEIVAIAQGMQKTNEVCWQIPIPVSALRSSYYASEFLMNRSDGMG